MTIFAVYSFSPFFVPFDLWLLAENRWLFFLSYVVHGDIVSALPFFTSCQAKTLKVIYSTFIRFVYYDIFLIAGFVTFYQFLWFIPCCRPIHRNEFVSNAFTIDFAGISTLIKRLDTVNYSTIYCLLDENDIQNAGGNCNICQKLSMAYHKEIICWPCQQMKVSRIQFIYSNFNVIERIWWLSIDVFADDCLTNMKFEFPICKLCTVVTWILTQMWSFIENICYYMNGKKAP